MASFIRIDDRIEHRREESEEKVHFVRFDIEHRQGSVHGKGEQREEAKRIEKIENQIFLHADPFPQKEKQIHRQPHYGSDRDIRTDQNDDLGQRHFRQIYALIIEIIRIKNHRSDERSDAGQPAQQISHSKDSFHIWKFLLLTARNPESFFRQIRFLLHSAKP